MGEALGWAREQGLSVEDDLSYVREFEHITLARVLLARRARVDRFDAMRTPGAAAAGGGSTASRTGSVIEILVLQALAHRDARRHRGCARAAGARPDAGRAGGLRPHVCGRRPAHGGAAAGGRETRDRPGLRPSTPGRILAQPRTNRPPAHELDRAAERARARRAAAARNRPGRTRNRQSSSWCR